MDNKTLRQENATFGDTKGVSQNCRAEGFRPAFLEETTGRIELARLTSGDPAPFHLISNLPREWATTVDDNGLVAAVKADIVSGFERDGVFYRRSELLDDQPVLSERKCNTA